MEDTLIFVDERKVYKRNATPYFRMFPSDPSGSLDDFYSFEIYSWGVVR